MLSKLLTLDPSKRITAKEALEHSYFKEEPIKCEPKDLPKIKDDSHEFQSRQIKKQLKMGNPTGEMQIGKGCFNQTIQGNPNYFNRNNQEVKYKIEETKIQFNTNIPPNVTESSLQSRLEAIQSENNSQLLSNKRNPELSLENEINVNVKKPKFSPNLP